MLGTIYVGGDDGTAKRVQKIYLGNDLNLAQQVKKVYIGGDDGTAKLVYAWATIDDLIDFKYTNNGNETYIITDWAGTTNGVSGTEIIIPDAQNIIL